MAESVRRAGNHVPRPAFFLWVGTEQLARSLAGDWSATRRGTRWAAQRFQPARSGRSAAHLVPGAAALPSRCVGRARGRTAKQPGSIWPNSSAVRPHAPTHPRPEREADPPNRIHFTFGAKGVGVTVAAFREWASVSYGCARGAWPIPGMQGQPPPCSTPAKSVAAPERRLRSRLRMVEYKARRLFCDNVSVKRQTRISGDDCPSTRIGNMPTSPIMMKIVAAGVAPRPSQLAIFKIGKSVCNDC